MYKIPYRKTKNPNSIKSLKKEGYKENKYCKHFIVNKFNIIELNEEEEINFENEPELNIFSEQEIQKLKKNASSIEEYYSNKSLENNINENCFNCLMSDFKPNELLYFSKRKDLLAYLKYCFYFKKKLLFLDYQTYIENRYDLDKCDLYYLNGWKFFIPKAVCKACFLQIINMKHLFGNLKKIFTDIDSHSITKNVYRNRNHLNPRVRSSLSLHRNNKNNNKVDNEFKGKNKIMPKSENIIKIKNLKNDNNISYDNKSGKLLIKKDIFDEIDNLIKKKEENGKMLKYHKKQNSEYKKNINNEIDAQTVTEIKIKTNEFIVEENLLKTNEKNNKEKNINKNKYNNKNMSIPKNEKKIENDSNNNNSVNQNSINNTNNGIKNNNEQKIKDEKQNNNINKNKKLINIYNEIFKVKHISNKTVIKLHYKLQSFKDILINTIFNIRDFIEKLYNSMGFNPEIISYGIAQYEQYFISLYNDIFKAKKEYENMFSKIKIECITSISKNISKLKDQEKLQEEEKNDLIGLENILKDFTQKIDDMIKKYNDSIDNFIATFIYFIKLIKEMKNSFSQTNY